MELINYWTLLLVAVAAQVKVLRCVAPWVQPAQWQWDTVLLQVGKMMTEQCLIQVLAPPVAAEMISTVDLAEEVSPTRRMPQV